jgi:MYXO-CTERM domain-containing protein
MPAPLASQVVHFGLAVFGDDEPAPGEQEILVDYAPCSEPNVAWALDPTSSCVEPGCTDPWSGPVIEWTVQDGSQIDPPDFALRTLSHMPRCAGAGMACEGSGRFPDLAIEEITIHHDEYEQATPYVHDDSTLFVNVLVVLGPYDATDAAVQTALEDAFAAGITTYVVAYGPQAANPGPTFSPQLESMADWGSGGALAYRTAENAGQLGDALRGVLAELELPCCASIDCSHVGGADSGADGVGGDADAGDADAGDEDAGADWGGLDGTAGDADAGDANGDTDSATASGGEIDDDGGCNCRTPTDDRRRTPWSFVLLAGLGRRRRRTMR